ncbi:MAG: hypothetical protein ABIU58_06710 [Ramlibacter sp.]
MNEQIVDAWMQFPSEAFLFDPVLNSLRRWPTHWRTWPAARSAAEPKP